MIETPNRSALVRLGCWCRRFGGRLELVTQDVFDVMFDITRWREDGDFHEAPAAAWHGVDGRTKTVYAVQESANPGAIVHEMGHLFATDLPVHNAREWEWFGWEVAMARIARCFRVWSTWMETYVMGYPEDDIVDDDINGEEWGNLWPDQRRAVIAERVSFARRLGIVGRDGRPRLYDGRRREVA